MAQSMSHSQILGSNVDIASKNYPSAQTSRFNCPASTIRLVLGSENPNIGVYGLSGIARLTAEPSHNAG